MLRRELPDHRSGEHRPDLLVRVAHVRDLPERLEPGLPHQVDGGEPQEQTALHVGHAGTVRGRPLDPERALGHGALVEHGVQVADEQHVWPAGTLQRADQEVAELRLLPGWDVGSAVHLPATGAKTLLTQIRDLVHSGGRVGAAVDVHHLLERRDELLPALGGEVAQGDGVHARQYRETDPVNERRSLRLLRPRLRHRVASTGCATAS
jgi:hypothetical protein